MAKDSTKIAINSDVQVIREILFGEHLQTLLTRIEDLEAKVSQLRNDLAKETSAREQQDQAGEEKLEKVRAKITGDLKEVNRGLTKRMESEFAAHRIQHDDLVTDLAAALMRYRQDQATLQEMQE